jgi:hypothetical protein
VRRLAAFSRVILFEKRGTGLSDRDVGDSTLEDRMDDLRAVLAAAGSDRAAIMVLRGSASESAPRQPRSCACGSTSIARLSPPSRVDVALVN